MENLYIPRTDSTPEIDFKANDLLFEIIGLSKPEDVRKFYYPVIDWLKEFDNEVISKLTDENTLKLNIKLSYFNSSSAKFLFDILDTIGEYRNRIGVKIYWYFEEGDEDHKEAGEELSEMIELPFNYIAVRSFEH